MNLSKLWCHKPAPDREDNTCHVVDEMHVFVSFQYVRYPQTCTLYMSSVNVYGVVIGQLLGTHIDAHAGYNYIFENKYPRYMTQKLRLPQ